MDWKKLGRTVPYLRFFLVRNEGAEGFGPWQLKTKTDLLCPHQTEVAVLSQFHVTFAHVLRCVSRPKVFQRLRTIGLPKMREPETSEDIETSALMRQADEDWVQAVTERVRLQKLSASRRVK